MIVANRTIIEGGPFRLDRLSHIGKRQREGGQKNKMWYNETNDRWADSENVTLLFSIHNVTKILGIFLFRRDDAMVVYTRRRRRQRQLP